MKCSRTRCNNLTHRKGLCNNHYLASTDRGMVNAAPARQHLHLLREKGWGYRELEAETGMSVQALIWIADGTHQVIRLATSRAILATPAPTRVIAKGGIVSTLGSRRRLEALAVMGWTHQAVSERCGLRVPVIRGIFRYDTAQAVTAAAIADVYDTLAWTPGPSLRVRQRAARNGWAPPLAWDDIENPDEKPAGRYEPMTPREIAEQRRQLVAELTEKGFSGAEIADRLGVAHRTITRDRQEAC